MNGSPELTLDLFTRVRSDFEKRQYRVLAALKKVSEDYRRNRIYPHLSHLVELYGTLKEVRDRLADLRSEFPKRIKKIDFVNREIEHEVVFVDGSDISAVEDLIAWALPHIKARIEEGKTIYEYVNDEIRLCEVGIVPSYREEGYFFVPDNEEARLVLFRYEVSLFRSAEDRFRALKTRFLKAVRQDLVLRSPNAIKLDLIEERKELPNPATYEFQTDLRFPFRETIFPVVKRKLLKQLSEERG